MERRTRRAWLLVALAVTFVAVLGLAPKTALADGPVAKIGDTEYDTLADAVAAAPKDGTKTTIELVADAPVSAILQIKSGANITLDLAGRTVTAEKAVLVRGSLTIQDSSNATGSITGAVTGLLQVSGETAELVIQGGTIQTEKTVAVSVSVSGAKFIMQGGELRAPEGATVLRVTNGETSIIGGTLVGNISVGGSGIPIGSTPSLTIGAQGDYGAAQIKGTLDSYLPNASINLVGGTIGGVTGTLPEDAVLTSRFSSDISSALPETGVQCVQQGAAWVVAELTPQSAGAAITHSNGEVAYYANAANALAALGDGDVLTLYRDVDAQLSVTEGITATLDLNGHTLSSDAASVVNLAASNTDLTVKNGSVVSTAEGNEGATIVMIANAPAQMTNVNLKLDNVDLSMRNSGGAGIQVYGNNTNNTVTLDGCKLTVPDDVMGIYFPPADSSLVINDTVINAGTGIGIKGGSLTVSGSSEIHAHGENDQSDIPATGGIAETGAAIYVDDGYAANDNRNVTVTIKDGAFSSDKGSAIQELVSKPGSNPPVQIAVSGGSFDDTSVAGYLVPDAAVAVGADGSCTVYPSVEEARANGGGYQVVDKDGNTWFFSTPEAATEFAKGQDDSAEVKEVLWTVTFDDCLDSTENQTVSVRNGEPVARPAEDPVCAGYRFLGWYSDKALTQAWDFDTPVRGDLTLYAKWEQAGGSTTTEKPATPSSDTTTVDGGLAKTSDPTLVAPLAASALAGASALGVALGLRRRDR